MIIGNSKFAFLALVAAGCLTAFAIGRRPRPLDKQQLEEGLRTWEDEGGATRFVKENSVAATERHSGSTRVSVEHIRR